MLLLSVSCLIVVLRESYLEYRRVSARRGNHMEPETKDSIVSKNSYISYHKMLSEVAFELRDSAIHQHF